MHPCLDRGFFVRKSSFYVYLFFEKAPPIIAVSPPPTVSASVGQIFIINSTTLGVPTPEIVWHLNRGCVLEKCTMSSTPQDGNHTFGELLIVHFSGTHPQFKRQTISGVGTPSVVQLIMNVWPTDTETVGGGLTAMIGGAFVKKNKK